MQSTDNNRFNELLELINKSSRDEPTNAEELSDALHTISAHYDLRAIIPSLKRFFRLADRDPRVFNIKGENIEAKFKLLRKISVLETDNEHFTTPYTSNSDQIWPLYGCTGDSAICELMLVTAELPAHESDYEKFLLWFCYLALNYYQIEGDSGRYKKYLLDGKKCYRPAQKAALVYAASREAKYLGEATKVETLKNLVGIGIEPDELINITLGTVLSFDDHLLETKEFCDLYELNADDFKDYREWLRSCLPSDLHKLLKVLWSKKIPKTSGGGGAGGKKNPTPKLPPQIRVISVGGKQSMEQSVRKPSPGTVWLEFVITKQPNGYVSAGRIVNPSGGRSLVMQEPHEQPTLYAPLIQLMDGPIQAQHFSALTIRHREEMRVAKLCFSTLRLSDRALKALRALIVPRDTDSLEYKVGKLIIALTLITGRDFSVVATTDIFWTYCAPVKSKPIGIDATNKQLVLFAPAPTVKSTIQKDETLFLKHSGEFTVPLPATIIELCNLIGWDEGYDKIKPPTRIKAAKKLLQRLPESLQINGATIRYQLGHKLYQAGRSDIGLEKVVTDCNEANANNIIHYSGYPTHIVMGLYSAIQDELLGTETLYSPIDQNTAIGCYTTFCSETVSDLLARLKTLVEQVDPRMEPTRAFNLITAYTACWLSLATAGRASTSPTPTIVVSGRAIINDKHRSDGSGLRSFPLTQAFQKHLKGYVEYVRRLAISNSDLQPLSIAPEDGLARLFLIIEGKVQPYTPTLLNEFLSTEGLPDMRGNWGRHFFEQAAKRAQIDTRLIDAAMGHAVAGRHPNANMSNFHNHGFQKVIVDLQTNLERTLGFGPISHLKDCENVTQTWHPLWIKRQQGFKEKPKKEPPHFDIEQMIKKNGHNFVAELKAETDIERQATVLNQVCIHVARQIAKEDQAEQLGECLGQLSDYLRKQHGIPAYRIKKHIAFAKEWVTELNDLINLSYFEEYLLPNFKKDLEHLPHNDSPKMSVEQDLGRLIMICIWRLGLTSWPLIYSFLKRYCAAPMLHTGNLHYVEIQPRAQRNKQACSRTVLIDDYSVVYLATRRQQLVEALEPILKMTAAKARAACERKLKLYVKEYLPEVPPRLLTSVTGSAKQWIWLNASPIIAAYSSQEFDTHDIGDNVIRRFHGLAPRGIETEIVHNQLSEGALTSKTFNAFKLLKEEKSSFYLKIANTNSPWLSERTRKLSSLKATNRPENVFLYFSRWFYNQGEYRHINRFSSKQKAYVRQQLSSVAYCIAAALPDGEGTFIINGDWIDSIAESFIENDFNVDISVVLGLFTKFLNSKEFNQVASRENLSLGDLTRQFTKGPLNNILAPLEMAAIKAELNSPIGPISSVSMREAARDLVELISLYGMRRNEALGLRGADFQGDMIRIQAYLNHRLKTAAADRCQPVAFMGVENIFMAENRHLHDQLINGAKHGFVNGHNFYDPINKLIQRVSRDSGLHLHSIRHTVASMMHLAANSESAPLEIIERYFPALSDLGTYLDRFNILVGDEGQTGHGEQAISALLGHAHPTTTQRHYVHTHCFSLFSALHNNDTVDPLKSFYHHLQSTRSNDNFIRDHKEDCSRQKILSNLVARAHKAHPEAFLTDNTPLEQAQSVISQNESENLSRDPNSVDIDSLLQMDIDVMSAIKAKMPTEDHPLLSKLARLFELKTKKKGSNVSRVKMDESRYTPIHQQLSAPSSKEAAPIIAKHLELLRTTEPEDYQWLLHKFLNPIDRERCRVQLIGASEAKRWRALTGTAINFVAAQNAVTKGIGRNVRKKVYYGQINIPGKSSAQENRDTSAVRWALTLALLQSGFLEHT
jgi:hypothetical protein